MRGVGRLRPALSFAGRPDSRRPGHQARSPDAADGTAGTADGAAHLSRAGILMELTADRAESREQRAERRGEYSSWLFALCSLLSALSRQRQSRDYRPRARHPARADHHAVGRRGRARSRAWWRRRRAAIASPADCRLLIDRMLMLNEVRRVAPPEPSACGDRRAGRAHPRSGSASPAELSRVLAARGLDETVLRMYAADDLRLASYLDERFSAAAQPTDEEIRQAGEVSAPAPDRRAPPCADRRMDRRAAAPSGRHSASVVLLSFYAARNTNISAALNPEWLTTGAMMLRRAM